MKKPVRSDKAPAAGKGSGGTASRDAVRQETRRVNVPRQSQRPAERSNQRRSRRP